MTLKYRQGHRQYTYALESSRVILINSSINCRRILYSFWDGRGNDNLDWNDLQMSFKVIKSDTNRKLVYELLLVVYSNFRRITHRFRDTSCFNAENHIFAYPTCICPWIWRSCRWNVETKFGAKKLVSYMGLPYGKEVMIVGRTLWAQSTSVTDGQTDRFIMSKTALFVASRGENNKGTLSK